MTIMQFKSFQSRILFFFLTLFLLVLVLTNILVSIANSRNAHEIIDADLKTASNIFIRLMDTRKRQLEDSARLLSSDYAFKAAFATGDRETITSALVNHQMRIGADMMMLLSTEKELLASTDPRKAVHAPLQYAALIEKAEESGEAYSLLVLREDTYQAVLVPLLAPTSVAWILLGFKVDDVTATDFKNLSELEISFFHDEGGGRVKCFASTIPMNARDRLTNLLKAGWKTERDKTVEAPMMDDTYISLKTEIGKTADGLTAYVVLQRSLKQLMKPFMRLQRILLIIAGFGLAGSAIAGIFIARSVSSPVKSLVTAVNRVQGGDYSTYVSVAQRDEIGTLANAINHMTDGLAEKDRVRNLLGKVVSHAVAEELLSGEVELGGEECEVTVLFSDIRSFTSIAEQKTPKEVLTLLNIYFTRMSSIVEEHGGVVDKYIGDAIMALFGAPLKHGDHADRAFLTALKMTAALEEINREFNSQGLPPLDIGIGINTDKVMVGNMGSQDRLNYTAIGDGVNVASRLEGLTKTKAFEAKIIISEQSLKKARGKYITRHLGQANIKGKSKAETIYALLGTE